MNHAAAGNYTSLRRRLLGWFKRHRRDLPWRRRRDPYAIWLSEIMLQQTQVATVIPYFEQFVRRFPTVDALAAAPIDEVLKLWAGLGYYARARNMHRAARMVVEQFDGEFPRTVDELITLSGVGRYTAGAVASIAFGMRAAVLDGNVTRVLSRLFDVRSDVSTQAVKSRLWQLAESMLPVKRCGDFNEAMMELGATVCLPGAAAQCGVCPISTWCAAQRAGVVAQRPVNRGRAIVQRMTHVVAAIRRGERYLFVRRAERGLWGGLWELPSAEVNGQSPAAAAAMLAQRALDGSKYAVRNIGKARGGLRGGTLRIHSLKSRKFATLEHVLTHRRIAMIGYQFELPAGIGPARATDCAKWLSLKDAGEIGLSRAMQRVVAALRLNGRAG